MTRVEVVQAALAQHKSEIESHAPSPFKRQSLRQKGVVELDSGTIDIICVKPFTRKKPHGLQMCVYISELDYFWTENGLVTLCSH